VTRPLRLSDPVEPELYKLAVEMADRVSARRGLANTFFLTVNTGLAALQSYRKLNAAKFKVINAIEPRLPLQLQAPARLWPLRDLRAWITWWWLLLSRARDGRARGSSP